ncbi:MAG: RluA family pseudouridine synthase [Planctomycetes bacterium]|nr:RluA family pseudouridine synthase [Planctomycetota bacterium]
MSSPSASSSDIPRAQVKVGASEAGFRADRALAALLPGFSRRDVKVLFRDAAVLLNGRPARGNETVKTGDVLDCPDPHARELRAQIVRAKAPKLVTAHGRQIHRHYEDEAILVLGKPPGIAIHHADAGPHRHETLEDVLKRFYPPLSVPMPNGERRSMQGEPKGEEAFEESEEEVESTDLGAEEDFPDLDTELPEPPPDAKPKWLEEDDADESELAPPPLPFKAAASKPIVIADSDDTGSAPAPLVIRRKNPLGPVEAPTPRPAPPIQHAQSKPQNRLGFWFCHRLDMDTTGCLLVAKTPEARDILIKQFAFHQIQKVYYAVVTGEVPWDERVIRRAIAYVKQAEENPRSKQVDSRAPAWVKRKLHRGPLRAVKKGQALREGETGGKSCETRVIVEERFKGYTLVRCEPRTGRLHQIRVHLAAEGHPLAYDPLYGRRTPLRFKEFSLASGGSEQGAEIVLNRVPLHAASLTFKHPVSGRMQTIEAAFPKDFKEFIRVLSKYRDPHKPVQRPPWERRR